MPFKVVAECIDIRNGRRFQPGEIFEPKPDAHQAVRLASAGCIELVKEEVQLIVTGVDGGGTGLPGAEVDDGGAEVDDAVAEVAATDVVNPAVESKPAKSGKVKG
jgi:hypothetical protein